MEPELRIRPSANGYTEVQLREFERCLRAAHDDLWWREYINIIKDRRMMLFEELAGGHLDQRGEDTLRGQISELAFTLALDAANKPPKPGEDNGRRTQAD